LVATLEQGSTGKDLAPPQQPIFVMAGLLVSDEKWRTTEAGIQRVIREAFDEPMPPTFELHACELLSPDGDGPFAGWDRDVRNQRAVDLLCLLEQRGHRVRQPRW
jgi:hypothetical protein